jgi:hypothetical protein
MTMAGIYNADVYCDDCVNDIKNRLATELFHSGVGSDCPDGVDNCDLRSIEETREYLDGMNESDYDSGDYPKYASDDAEADSPTHCGSYDACLNAEDVGGDFKVGYCFGNDLTADGAAYVKKVVREGGACAELWREKFDWIDFPNECEHCGRDCDEGYTCESCEEDMCVNCADIGDLDENGECEQCASDEGM